MAIFHAMERRDLTAAYRFYCDRELEGAHDALADVTATLEVLDAQLGRYPDLPADIDGLHRFCNPDEGRYVDRSRKFVWNDQGEAVFTFGKLAGRSLDDVAADRDARGYLEWMLGKDFSEEVKAILRDALAGVFPRRT
jgi:DNA polymerase-3 subunit epsilon